MKTSLPFVLLPACLALLGACSPTPSDRIAKNMQAYEQLPKEQQAKVARGELEKGMSPMAVLLAWGEPEQKMAGRMNGKSTPGRRRIPQQGFRGRHRDRRHDAPGQPSARFL